MVKSGYMSIYACLEMLQNVIQNWRQKPL